MKKKKKIGWRALLALAPLIAGCATANNGAYSKLVIVNHAGTGLYLHIEGKERVKLSSGKTMTETIPNGHHVIMGDRIFYRDPAIGSLPFDCYHERIYIAATVINRLVTFTIINRTSLSQKAATPLLEHAVKASFAALNPLIPPDSKIAILAITPEHSDSLFMREELMVLFVNSGKYQIVERQALDAIRQEQRFQMSGEVSDETAAGIGHFLGAGVVIVGTVSANGARRRLRLRALSVKTVAVIAMSSEAL